MDEDLRKLPAKERWSIAHAVYERLCYDEFYYYSTALEDPDKHETVVLKGPGVEPEEIGSSDSDSSRLPVTISKELMNARANSKCKHSKYSLRRP